MTDPEFSGSPPVERPSSRSRARRPRLLLGVAAALTVATGAGLATAGSTSQARPPQVQPQAVQSGPYGMVQLAQLEPMLTARGYETFTSQTGTVSSVQTGSIAVGDDSGGTRTYTVDDTTRVFAGAQGINGISTGDTVWVIGTTGDNPTAILITDASRPPLPGHEGGAPATPTTPTTPTSPTSPTSPTESPSPETVPPTG